MKNKGQTKMPRYTGDNNNNIFTAPNDGLSWVISGKGGDDFLTGGNNDDVINGDEGNDTIYGGDGNDNINGGEGYDYIYGGDGDDILVDTQGSVDGGAGIDFLKADYSQFDNGAGIHVGWLGYNIIFSRVDGSGLLTYNNVERFEITGTKYNDVLQGYAYNDNLNGGDGDDQISGGAGFDILNGGDGNDVLIDTDGIVDGGAGIDTLIADYSQFNNGAGVYFGVFGREGIHSLSGGEVLLNYTNIEQFHVTGTQYGDLLAGSDRNDILNGGAGNDGIGGGAGYDYLFGGDGDDILVDIDGNVDGGAGTDTLRADYSRFNNGFGIEVGYNGENLIYSNILGISGFTDNNPLYTSAANSSYNSLYSGTSDNGSDDLSSSFILLRYSNIEKFEITGTQYADILRGGDGDDSLTGGLGNDILVGGFGNDTLVGGAGADKFVFNSIFDSSDIIKDFNSAEGDKIQVSPLGFSFIMSIGSSGVDHNSFSYNNATGDLFYQGIQFATLENKPTDFVVNQDILIV